MEVTKWLKPSKFPQRPRDSGAASRRSGVASSSFENDDEANLEAGTTVLRFRFSGPLQPECIYDFDVSSRTLTPRKQDPAKRWLDRNRYAVDRLYATASDGEAVPLTIVYRKTYAGPAAIRPCLWVRRLTARLKKPG